MAATQGVCENARGHFGGAFGEQQRQLFRVPLGHDARASNIYGDWWSKKQTGRGSCCGIDLPLGRRYKVASAAEVSDIQLNVS